MEKSDLTMLTADIVAAHVSNNSVAIADIGTLVERVHGALSGLGTSVEEAPKKAPAVSVRASVKPDYIVCLECGKKQKMLKRHLQTAHAMTTAEYRQEFGLPAAYPMTAPNYSEMRRTMARSIGLGRKGKTPPGPAGAAKAPRKPVAKKRTRRPAKAKPETAQPSAE